MKNTGYKIGPTRHSKGGDVYVGEYMDGRGIALAVFGELGPELKLTVNPPKPLSSSKIVVVKNYSENAGALEAMEAAGLGARTGSFVPLSDFVQAPVFSLDDEFYRKAVEVLTDA